MSNMLWEKTTYTIDTPYIIAHNIYEYDIKKANINVLLALGLISKEYYDKLNKMDRMQRQVEIGFLIKEDPDLYGKLSDGIKSYKKKLFDYNGIEDIDIISVKNDAVFIKDKMPDETKFDNVEFVLKNSYTSFVMLGRHYEVYFASDMVNNTASIDVKGINDIHLQSHHKYMASVIVNVLLSLECGDVNDALSYISEIYNLYIERKLDIGYYRTFDSESIFPIVANGSIYKLPYCDPSNIGALDISYNLTNVIRKLYDYAIQIYFSR